MNEKYFGFEKVSVYTGEISPLAPEENANRFAFAARREAEASTSILLFGELALTGAQCGDALFRPSMMRRVLASIVELEKATSDLNMLIAFGAPFEFSSRYLNCILWMFKGEIIAIYPKKNNPPNSGFSTIEGKSQIVFNLPTFQEGKLRSVPVSNRSSIYQPGVNYARIATCFIDDLPDEIRSIKHSGTTLLYAPGVMGVDITSTNKQFALTSTFSTLTKTPTITTWGTFGTIADKESQPQNIFAAFDANGEPIEKIGQNSYIIDFEAANYHKSKVAKKECIVLNEKPFEEVQVGVAPFETKPISDSEFLCHLSKLPFVKLIDMYSSPEEVLRIASSALYCRMSNLNNFKVVLGLSGGLDSAITLEIAYEAFERIKMDTKNITVVMMPGFGTSEKTSSIAEKLVSSYGVSVRTIPISKSVSQHFSDIGHDESIQNTTYENAQARERTQILLDIANETGAFVLGTGDLSESLLGWCTFGGDQLSHFNVISSIPKTALRVVALYLANTKSVFGEIAMLPISPELLPPDKQGNISQKTESSVGPYEVIDFFFYHALRDGWSTQKACELAKIIFKNQYSPQEIENWITRAAERFTTSAFKRKATSDWCCVFPPDIYEAIHNIPSDLGMRDIF